MTQLTNGSVMVNMRHTSAKTVGRGVAVSNDNGADIVFLRCQMYTKRRIFAKTGSGQNIGNVDKKTRCCDSAGDTFGPITYDSALISPVCQGSLVTFGGATYFSNPESTSGR